MTTAIFNTHPGYTGKPVLIIGAGLAGLTCATHLHRAGIPYRIFDKSDAVGGRVRTDSVEGFRLDRGFQVLLTAYPEAESLLDYDALDLHPFDAGALIRKNGRFQHVSDPLRHPGRSLATLSAKVGSFSDKLRVLSVRRAAKQSFEKNGSHRTTGETTADALRKSFGFSDDMIASFFRPFIGGITLDPSLKTDRAFFEFVMHMFSEGYAAFPAGGMQAIPEQLAAGLNPEWIHLDTPVEAVMDASALTTEAGERIDGERIVVATDMNSARTLANDPGTVTDRPWNGTVCLYFRAPVAPLNKPLLMLNGEGEGLINNVVVPSLVAPGYAPEGEHLVAVSVFPDDQVETDILLARVEDELTTWFGSQTREWRHLRTYHIPHSLPSQAVGSRTLGATAVTATERGFVVCGDHLTTSSINGAMASGRQAAQFVMSSFALS